MKKVLIIFCSILCIISLTIVLSLPKTPNGWNDVKLGMTSEEVQKNVTNLATWREEKGFDLQTLQHGDSYWQVFFYYDQNKVSKVSKRYYSDTLGVFLFEESKLKD